MSPDSKEILHNSVYRREPLHVGGRREAPHLALPLTRRLVGDLGSIVRVLTSDVDHGRHHGAARGGVGAPPVVGAHACESGATRTGLHDLPGRGLLSVSSESCTNAIMRLQERHASSGRTPLRPRRRNRAACE